MPDEYSLYEAKSRLSALVKQVREGRTITITVHGEPAAELRPIKKGSRKQTLAERINELEATGQITSARQKPGDPGGLRPIAQRPGALKRFLAERD
ncbi:MAG: type II toxin-antitoxin system prevent-host-death family antitoxin [bacterium]